MNRKKGFTLIELIVTIALLGIIGTVIAINVVGLSKKQDTKETVRIEEGIKAAAEAYEHVEDIGTGCLPIKNLVDSGYLRNNNVSKYIDKFVLIKENTNHTKTYEIKDTCNGQSEATKNKYKIVYKKNLDETVSNMPSDTTNYKLNEQITLSKKIPTTFGYTFKYWSLSKNGLKIEEPIKMKKSGLTLYAIWQKKTFNIVYDAQGGTPNSINQSGKYKSYVSINANNPSKLGYTFKNWKDTNTNKTYVKNDKIYLDKNITLNAQYEKSIYQITLDHKGGQNNISKIYEKYNDGFYSDPNAANEIASPNIENGNKITIIMIPTKTGYDFQGYYTQADGKGTKYIDETGTILASNTSFTKDTTLYAYWSKKEYTTTINVTNGNKNEPILNKIKYQESGEQKFTPKSGYGNATVSCSGLSTYSYDKTQNILKLSDVKSDISCDVKFVETNYIVTLNVENGTSDDLYNQILNRSKIYNGLGTTDVKSEPIITKYGYVQESISLKQFVQEINLQKGSKITLYNNFYIDGIYTGLKVDQNTGRFYQTGMALNSITWNGTDFTAKTSKDARGYFRNTDGTVVYRIFSANDSNVTKYKIVDIISNTSGLYLDSSDNSYYFRGEINNNYVKFAGKTWRILGINSDKSIRLIGDFNIGETVYSDTTNYTKLYKEASDLENNLKYYIGYTYNNTRACIKNNPCVVKFNNGKFTNESGGINSKIKEKLEQWYITNLAQYDDYITMSEFENLTYPYEGKIYTSEDSYLRFATQFIATSKQIKDNKYPPNPSINIDDFSLLYGGYYKSKIGTISASEVNKSGFINGYTSKNNTDPLNKNFLKTNYTWWTMTPSYVVFDQYYSNKTKVFQFNPINIAIVNEHGLAESAIVDQNSNSSQYYVRPVISLRSGIRFTGNGTKENPYIIKTTENNENFPQSFNVNKNDKLEKGSIFPNYGYDFEKVTCSNNQTGSYDTLTKKFSIKPTNNTQCTIKFSIPKTYTISIHYPYTSFTVPGINVSGGYYTYNKKDEYTLTYQFKTFNLNTLKASIVINSYYTNFLNNGLIIDKNNSTCTEYNVDQNNIMFNTFSNSFNGESCEFQLLPPSNSNDDDNICDLVCDSGSFDDTDSNQDDCWCE